MPPRQHARLAPSAAYRWSHCPGSIKLIESVVPAAVDTGVGELGDEYAEFGIRGHAMAEADLLGNAREHGVDHELEDIVATYVSYVLVRRAELSREYGPLATLIVEQKVSLHELHPPEAIYGTPDVQLIGPTVLEIVDLKTGYVDVQPEGNEQLASYAAGVLGKLQPYHPEKIFLTIVQPRSGGIKTWETTVNEIMAIAQRLVSASWDVDMPNAPLVPGNHCRFCPAQAYCPALKAHAVAITRVDFEAPIVVPPPPESVPLELAADILRKAEALKGWFTALEARITAELEAGRVVPGWKLVAKRARRVWLDPDRVRHWVEVNGVGSEAFEPASLKSVAQMEKVVGKKHLPDDLWASYSSGTTAVPETDSRRAVQIGSAVEFTALPPASSEADTLDERH